VHGEAVKLEKQYVGKLRSTGKFISANAKYWACPSSGGGGPVVIHEHDNPGRIENYFQLEVHSNTVEQCHFSPFAENLLLTSSSDALIKLSAIPADIKSIASEKTSLRELSGHYKKVDFCSWNPLASNVVASASGDNTVKFWDIENQSEFASFGKEIVSPTSFAWNDLGSLAAVGSKEEKNCSVHLFDPRTPTGAVHMEAFGKANQGTSFVFADNHNCLIGLGRSATNTRQWKLWDLRSLGEKAAPLETKDMDSGAGVLQPFYDPDNSILYLAGGGDSTISYWELSGGNLHFLTQFSDTKPQKVVAWLPKKAMNVKACEIARALRLIGGSGTDNVVPVQFQVPRKSDLFQKDLYPDTNASIADLSSDEWKESKVGKIKKQSMAPGAEAAAVVVAEMSTKKSYAQLEAEVVALTAEVARLKAKAGE